MKPLVFLFVTSAAAFAQMAQPSVSNAHFETRTFSGDLARDIRSNQPAWFGYAVKTTRRDDENCCWNGWNQSGCGLEGSATNVVSGTRVNTPVQLEGADQVAVLYRFADNKVEKVHVYSLNCPLDAGGLPFTWVTGVPAHASIQYLQMLTSANASDRLLNGAVFAMSQHDDPEAVNTLIQIAKGNPSPHARSQALFWLAQKAGRQAAAAITDAIENDPDTKVKRQAVFALSQMPKEEGVPKLIEVARTQRNREVRKQAFFWLGQSHDPRALAFIEEVLTK